jgi:hypothetical protein
VTTHGNLGVFKHCNGGKANAESENQRDFELQAEAESENKMEKLDTDIIVVEGKLDPKEMHEPDKSFGVGKHRGAQRIVDEVVGVQCSPCDGGETTRIFGVIKHCCTKAHADSENKVDFEMRADAGSENKRNKKLDTDITVVVGKRKE